MPRKRKPESTDADRDFKRINTPFSIEEFQQLSALADSEFGTLAETVRDLALTGLAFRQGQAPADPDTAKPKGPSLAQEKTRKLALENELREIELKRKQKIYGPVDAFVKTMLKAAAELKRHIDVIPSEMAGYLNTEQLAQLREAINNAYAAIRGDKQWQKEVSDQAWDEADAMKL